jgi:hypothetical protein
MRSHTDVLLAAERMVAMCVRELKPLLKGPLPLDDVQVLFDLFARHLKYDDKLDDQIADLMGWPRPTQLSAVAPGQCMYLSVGTSEFRAAGGPPPGLSPTRNGLPCFYYWGDGLVVGKYTHPTRGFALNLAARDIDELCATFGRTRANGVDVPIVTDHVESAEATLGYIVGMKHEGGRGWLLHQFLGEDARDCGLRNKISVGIDPDFKDGKGNAYGRAIRHSAATPMPVITGQKGFIAASGAEASGPVVLALSTAGDRQMDLMRSQVAAYNPAPSGRNPLLDTANRMYPQR